MAFELEKRSTTQTNLMTHLVEQQSDVCALRDTFEDSKNECEKIDLFLMTREQEEARHTRAAMSFYL